MVINDYEKAKSLFAESEIKVFQKGKDRFYQLQHCSIALVTIFF